MDFVRDMKRKRLDDILIARGIAEDRQDAFVIVTEGRVFVAGQKAVSGSQIIGEEADIKIREDRRFVGRGAYKLEAALSHFALDPREKICLDVGAATGGFTEVLLNRGAKKVYAVDTARGKIAVKLRDDGRIVLMEGVDIRGLKELPDEIELVTIDVSLIPLREILPHAKRFLARGGAVVALLKPQYETRDPKILRRGIVKNPRDRRKILEGMIRAARDSGWEVRDWMESPIRGSKGNVEYLLHLRAV